MIIGALLMSGLNFLSADYSQRHFLSAPSGTWWNDILLSNG